MGKSIHRTEYRILIDQLRQAREAAGLTQGEVATALGWPQSTLSHVEGGSRRLDVVEFTDYCRTIKVDALKQFGEFLKRVESAPLHNASANRDTEDDG